MIIYEKIHRFLIFIKLKHNSNGIIYLILFDKDQTTIIIMVVATTLLNHTTSQWYIAMKNWQKFSVCLDRLPTTEKENIKY